MFQILEHYHSVRCNQNKVHQAIELQRFTEIVSYRDTSSDDMPVRLKLPAPRSQVKHSTTEPLRSLSAAAAAAVVIGA